MSLLDDARRMSRDQPIADDLRCYYCHRQVKNTLAGPGENHASDCPILALPKIVAALEAAAHAHEAWSKPYAFDSVVIYERMVALGKSLRGDEVQTDDS